MSDCPGTPAVVFVCLSARVFALHHLPLAESAARSMEAHAILNPDEQGAIEAVRKRGILVHALPVCRPSVNPARILLEAAKLRRMLRTIHPVLVNAIGLKSLVLAALAGAGKSGALVGTITGLGYMFAGDSPGRSIVRGLTCSGLARLLAGRRHVLVFSNREDRDEFLARAVVAEGAARVLHVPGVDAGRFPFTPEPDAGYRVVLPARMLWDKGIGEFIQAAEILSREFPEAEFILAGGTDPGNPTDVGEAFLRQRRGKGGAVWLGHCGAMPELLASCHAVCLPSYREGFPRVVVEAMSCGRAVVASDVPGCRDALAGTGAGLLVPPRDVSALVRALRRLHDRKAERREMGRRGRRRVENGLTIERITSSMLELFAEMRERCRRD